MGRQDPPNAQKGWMRRVEGKAFLVEGTINKGRARGTHLEIDFPLGTHGKEHACQCRRHKRHRFNPYVGKIPGGGLSNLVQYSGLENPMDRGTWWATVHGVTQSQTRLKRLSMHTHTHTWTRRD